MASLPKLVLVGGDGGRSGVPRHIEHLCHALAERAEISVLSDKDRGGYAFANSLRHVVVPGLATSLNPVSAIRAHAGLLAALSEIRPDLVWAHARMSLPLCRWALRSGNLGRLMVTYHGLPFGPGHGPLKSSVSRVIEAASLRVSDRHDAVFLTSEDRTAMEPSLRGHRLHLLPNSSRLGGFNAGRPMKAGDRTLVMLTRDSSQKNLDLAARVFRALPDGFKLSLYGMGTESDALKRRFSDILGGAIHRVMFHGDTADVRPALASADGLLVTSRYEGLSISMIEAMEAGLPIFSTPVGGTKMIQQIHPLFGTITDDLSETARTIDRMTATFHQSPEIWREKIHAAWRGTFSPELWTKKVRDLVDDVLNGRP